MQKVVRPFDMDIATESHDNFRKYNTWLESITDHDKLLSENSRYAGAMAVKNDPEPS